MAVDVHIGSVETVIEAGEGSGAGGADRQRLIAEILRVVRAELTREAAETAMRAHDTAPRPRSFGQRN
jgi:tRNA A58 N-methylase Trm61